MRRILSSIFIGLILGLLTWLFNWLTNGNGYITYVPITMGGIVTGYFDHLLDPLMYVLAVFFLKVGWGLDKTVNGAKASFTDSFISACITVPAMLSILATFVVGAQIAFIASVYMLSLGAVAAVVAYVIWAYNESKKCFGDNP